MSAISLYNDSLEEEQGGFILKYKDDDNFEFIPVTNKLTGTNGARGLYIAEDQEFYNKVAFRTVDDNCEIYASYHTHPKGMRALPSSIDLTQLFLNFPINYIYAPEKELNQFKFNPNAGEDEFDWTKTNVANFYGFAGKWIEPIEY